jgi:hypothetical protein
MPLYIVSYPPEITGRVNETVTITVEVYNDSTDTVTCRLEVVDHNNKVVAYDTKDIAPMSSDVFQLSVTLSYPRGSYTWKIRAYNSTTGAIDDEKTIAVIIQGYTTRIALEVIPL